MTAVRIERFGGEIPAIDPRLLPPENAVYTQNAYLQSGRLEPLSADIAIHRLDNPMARYAFRVPKSDPGIDSVTQSYWLEFLNPNTTVVRSPITQLADGGRYYWANGTTPPGYTTKTRLAAGDLPLVLGIPRPSAAPVVTVSGGASSINETRAYVYTWVSSLGEEGQPSPPAVQTGKVDDTWTVNLTLPGPGDTTNRDLTKTRIYRTVTAADGNVGFFFVIEVDISTISVIDNVSSDEVANAQALPSEDWTPPPEDLAGMVSMPNGMIAGWRGQEVWFCEPYRPHAWPIKYTLGVESPIVGLGTIDQNLMVLTSGQPYVATGIHPAVMALRKVQPTEPCTAQGSIVSMKDGVLYTSNNGLMLIGPGGGENITFNMIRKDDWAHLLNLREIHATYFMNGYYVYSGVIDGAFQKDAFQNDAFQVDNPEGVLVGAHIALGDQRLGYMTLKSDTPTFNVMLDIWTGETFVLRDEQIFHVDRRQPVPRQPYIWRSKIMQLPYKDNFAAVKVFYNQPEGAPPSGPTTFRLYGDDRLRFERTLPASGQMFRLPSGYKADFFQFEVEGEVLIYNFQIATSAKELRQV